MRKTTATCLVSSALFIALVFFTSCTSLSKSQIKVCNSYFSDLAKFSNYATSLNEKTAEVKFNRKMLYGAGIDSVHEMIIELDSAIYVYQKEVVMPFELRKSIVQIDSYVNSYSFKSSYNTDFLANTKTFLVDYIPFGLGSIIYEILHATRKIIIKPNVGKKMRKHVLEGSVSIAESSTVINRYSGQYINELKGESEATKIAYENFLNGLKEESDTWDKYTKYNPVFVKHYGEVIYTTQMAEHLKTGSTALDSLQLKMSELMSKRRRIKGEVPELTRFGVEISYLNKLQKLLDKNIEHAK